MVLFTLTLTEYISREHTAWIADKDLTNQIFDPLYLNLKGEHYALVCEHCKNGGGITKNVYDSLDSINQYHFNKHYNHRNNLVK